MSADNVRRLVPHVDMTEGTTRWVQFHGITEESVFAAAGRWIGERRDTADDAIISDVSWHMTTNDTQDNDTEGAEDTFTLTLHSDRMDDPSGTATR